MNVKNFKGYAVNKSVYTGDLIIPAMFNNRNYIVLANNSLTSEFVNWDKVDRSYIKIITKK